MKKPIRLKSGGFISSGTDAGDLAILRTAKNIDDGSGSISINHVNQGVNILDDSSGSITINNVNGPVSKP